MIKNWGLFMATKFKYPWDQAPDWANWAATDARGVQFWYENEPVEKASCFFSKTGRYLFFSIIGPCENWKESKQSRPNSGN